MSRTVLLAAALSACLAAPAFGQSVVLVLHAERADTAAGGAPSMAADPDLSEPGRARAQRLAGMLRVNIENPLDEVFTLGSTALAYEPDRSDTLKVSGSVEVLFSDFTQYTKFANASDVDIILRSTDGTYSITYNLDKARLIQRPRTTAVVSG